MSSLNTYDLALAAVCCCILMDVKERKKRTIWAKKWLRRRSEYGRGALSLLHKELKVEDRKCFKNFLRMDEENFNYLLNKTKHMYTYQDTNMRQCISPRDRLSATLRYLATGETITSLSYTFRIGKSTLSTIITEVVHAIYDCLKEEYLKVPSTEEEWFEISKDFLEKWNFPNCLGAIDGKHITFLPSRKDGSFYRNYKGTDSIVLLAVVDANYKFICIDVGINGRISDGGVFQRSAISQAFQKNMIHIPNDTSLPNTDDVAPYVLVGDDAFPSSYRIIKPFRYHGLSHEQKIYNYRVSRARRVVENAFGILANRFRILLKPMNVDVDKVENITLACCALHNFLLKNYVQYGTLEENENQNLKSVSWKTPNRSAMQAMVVRDIFLEYFNGIGAVSWQDDYIQNK